MTSNEQNRLPLGTPPMPRHPIHPQGLARSVAQWSRALMIMLAWSTAAAVALGMAYIVIRVLLCAISQVHQWIAR